MTHASSLGQPVPRVDSPAKVTGQAIFAADQLLEGAAFAALATSAVGKGRVLRINRNAAEAVRGVLAVLTHEDLAGAIRPVGHVLAGGYANSTLLPLVS